jgi:4-alpha-glucanotransferase
VNPPGARRAGVLVPLFSIPSSRSWGIGEIGDLERLFSWLADAGQRVLQLLPITEVSPDDASPYGSLSAMAIDPLYITLDAMEDFAAAGGESGLAPDQRAALDRARESPAIDHRLVRDLKQAALRRAFAHFVSKEWAGGTARAAALRAFTADQAWWLENYALFRALHARHAEKPWMEWPQPVRSRQPHVLEIEHLALGDEVLFRQYLQWVAGEQWAEARARARARGVAIFGDLPFVVSADSADVWARQDEFLLEESVGAPPDAFSETGQDWSLPPYRWDVVSARDFSWLRERVRRFANLFDGCRVDHVVGFYRTYVRPPGGGAGRFSPADEASQLSLGERALSALTSAPMQIVAEDLGTVPDFVRQSLARLSIPGCKVFRWERQWHEAGQPFKDPVEYPEAAMVTSGTHDTESMTVWWQQAPVEERRAVLAIHSVQARMSEEDRARAVDAPELSPATRAILLEILFASGSTLLILPIQDVFGWPDRINRPGTIGDHNWTWRLPWPVDRLSIEPEAVHAAGQLREWSRTYER